MSNRVKAYSQKPDTNIYYCSGALLLEKGEYVGEIDEVSSLIRLLYLFELPIENVLEGLIDKRYKIEEIVPISPLVIFLLLKMKSSYWIGLLFEFLLDEKVAVKLSNEAIDVLLNRTYTAWLPQRNFHQVKKIVNKSNQIDSKGDSFHI
jgi:hypothetical protein